MRIILDKICMYADHHDNFLHKFDEQKNVRSILPLHYNIQNITHNLHNRSTISLVCSVTHELHWQMWVWMPSTSLLVIRVYLALPATECLTLAVIIIIIINIIKKGGVCKAEREWYTPYQSEDPSPTIPTCRQKEAKVKKSRRL